MILLSKGVRKGEEPRERGLAPSLRGACPLSRRLPGGGETGDWHVAALRASPPFHPHRAFSYTLLEEALRRAPVQCISLRILNSVAQVSVRHLSFGCVMF